jgi:cyclase
MGRSSITRSIAAGILLTLTWVAYTQTQTPQLTTIKVKDHLFSIEGEGGNVGVLITSEGVILIDDKYDQDHDAIVEQIKRVTSLPVRYILTTHHHSDHSGGNGKFLSSAEIISTVNARTNIVERKQPNVLVPSPARLTFTDQMSVFLGGEEVRAKYFGRGHTNGDAVIYLPALRTIHTGDLMSLPSPLIDYAGGGSLIEWTRTLDDVMKLNFDTVIPGHGNVTDKAGLLAYRNNVEKLRNRVSDLIRQGKSQEDVAKVLTAEYKWAPDSVYMQWSLHGLMIELK